MASLTESLLPQALRDQRERGLAVPDGLAVLAPRPVHRAKIPVGDNLDGDVRLRLADGQGAKSGPERRREVAGQRELDHLVVQRAAEAALVADGLREGFGLVEEGPYPALFAEQEEGVAEVTARSETPSSHLLQRRVGHTEGRTEHPRAAPFRRQHRLRRAGFPSPDRSARGEGCPGRTAGTSWSAPRLEGQAVSQVEAAYRGQETRSSGDALRRHGLSPSRTP